MLTTKEVCKKYNIHPATLRNWRRGWYSINKQKFAFSPDQSRLEAVWKNNHWLHDENIVKKWIKLLSHRRYSKTKYRKAISFSGSTIAIFSLHTSEVELMVKALTLISQHLNPEDLLVAKKLQSKLNT